MPLAPTPTCRDSLPHQMIPLPRPKMRCKKGSILSSPHHRHHLNFPFHPNQRKAEVSFSSTPPQLRAPGLFQKLNVAQVPHPSPYLSTVCQALLKVILRALPGTSSMLHLPHPPPSPSFHVPRHHKDHPSRHFANSTQSRPNASAHQNFTCAPCAQPLSLLLLLLVYGRTGAAAAHLAHTHPLISLSLTPTIPRPLLQGTGNSLSHRPRPIYLPPLGPLFLQVHVLPVQTSPHPLRQKTQYQLLPFQPSCPIFFTWGPRSLPKSMFGNFRALACAGF